MYLKNEDMKFLVKLEEKLSDDICYPSESKKLHALNARLNKKRDKHRELSKKTAAKQRDKTKNGVK